MTTDDPGDVRCKLCKQKAVHHRLTAAGRLYCLDLARHAHVRWFEAVEVDPGVVYRMPVGQLRPGGFAEGIGVDLARRVHQ